MVNQFMSYPFMSFFLSRFEPFFLSKNPLPVGESGCGRLLTYKLNTFISKQSQFSSSRIFPFGGKSIFFQLSWVSISNLNVNIHKGLRVRFVAVKLVIFAVVLTKKYTKNQRLVYKINQSNQITLYTFST